MTDNEVAIVENERIADLSRRMASITNIALVAVCLLLAVSLFFVVRSASETSGEFRNELACRAVASSDYDLALGELQTKIAQGLVMVARDEPLADVSAELELLLANLEDSASARLQAITSCTG